MDSAFRLYELGRDDVVRASVLHDGGMGCANNLSRTSIEENRLANKESKIVFAHTWEYSSASKQYTHGKTAFSALVTDGNSVNMIK